MKVDFVEVAYIQRWHSDEYFPDIEIRVRLGRSYMVVYDMMYSVMVSMEE